jgi:arsenate reductase
MKRVLFVDVRNATRSQMAEAWFNHLAGNQARAQSCGTLPGERVGVRAVQVMRELGIDISRKWPKPVTQGLLDQADVVVFMGAGIYPRVHRDVRYWDFEDPTGKPLDQVLTLRDQICHRVEQLIAEIARETVGPAWLDWNAFLPKQWQEVWY